MSGKELEERAILVLGLEPNMTPTIAGIMVLGIAVGLAFPTLMDAGTAALPASS